MSEVLQQGAVANAQSAVPTASSGQASPLAWQEIVAKYQEPSRWRSIWQIINTLVPYAVIWYLMYRSLAVSYWITLPLAILAGGFLVRIFIIHHDCGHGAFFRTRATNGMTEGFNGKAKLVKRRAYGYRSFRNYRLRLLNACA